MRILLQQLQRQRTLPGDHHRMIERWHPGKALLLRQVNGARFGFIKIRPVKQDFAAKTAYRIDFDVSGGDRHHDQRFQPYTCGRKRHALGVIPRRCGDNTARFLLFR
ncbi:hypothetical protein D3C87_1813890 [compost metagenome]